MKRFGRTLGIAVFVLTGMPSAAPGAQAPSLMVRLKAAVLSKFPQFVEWPAAALDGRTTVDICIATPDPFGQDLPDLVAGQTLNGRPFAAREVAREEDLDGCQVLYLPPRAPRGTDPLLLRARSLPILTVGDGPRFLDDGGIVALRVVDGRVRFDINATAAQRAGLRMSSQLLRLALSVRGSVS